MYIPYRTSITSGDITRDMVNVGQATVGRIINYMRNTYSSKTGYTQQNYGTSNTVSPQTNAITRYKTVNKPTPNTFPINNVIKGGVNK